MEWRDKYKDGRLKIFWVDPGTILTILDQWRHHSVTHMPAFEGLPKERELLEIHYCFERRQFGFLIWSPSFPEVPQGEVFPSVVGNIMWHPVKIKDLYPDNPIEVRG